MCFCIARVIVIGTRDYLKFKSQCSLVSYLESGMCKVGNELDNCDYTIP